MTSVNPSLEHIAQFERDTPDDKAIVMLNLLRFRARADYGEGAAPGLAGVTGREAYSRYGKAVLPLLWEVGGQVLWMGNARAGIIVPDGESWDEVVLVHYPSRRAFLRMVRSDAYQAIMHHRTAALADSRLVETRAVSLPRWVLGLARRALRMKTLLVPRVGRG
jgi:uncharacterized protein (DUF1330 family)